VGGTGVKVGTGEGVGAGMVCVNLQPDKAYNMINKNIKLFIIIKVLNLKDLFL
jgi:hypothetical protein